MLRFSCLTIVKHLNQDALKPMLGMHNEHKMLKQSRCRTQRVGVAAHINNIICWAANIPGQIIDISAVTSDHWPTPMHATKNSPASSTSAIAPSMSPVIQPIRLL